MTFMAKAGQVERKWYVIDAAGKPLGRVAAQAAVLLRGKHKPTYTPHVDCGDCVISKTLSLIHSVHNSGHFLIPNSQAVPPLGNHRVCPLCL